MFRSGSSVLPSWFRGPSLATLSLLALTLVAAAQSPQPQQTVTISGRVFNSVTRQPIARVHVCSTDNRLAAMTDDQGHFEFTLPRTNTEAGVVAGMQSFQLMARKPGYLVPSGVPLVNVQLSSDVADLTISLAPEAILAGHVSLSAAESADRVQVQLYRREIENGLSRWVPQNAAMTDSQGDFRFADLRAGDYRVGTHEAGDRDPEDIIPGGKMFSYPPVYFPAAFDFPSASTIHMTPGKVFDAQISLVRKQYFPVKIALSNGPIAGMPVNVTVSLQGDGAPGYSLGYNPADQTIRGFLPNGTYVVEAFTFTQPATSGTLILRVSNAPAETGQLAMLTHASIEVRVKEEFTTTEGVNTRIVMQPAGAPFRRLHQYLNVSLEPFSDFRQSGSRYLRPPRTANDESLAIDDVFPGRYWVRVNSEQGYAASVTSGDIDLLHAPLVVGPGSTAPIEITMRDDMASLDGVVEGIGASSPTGNPAYVYCIPLPDSPGQFTQVWVTSEGKFETQIVPGGYRLLAFDHLQTDLEYQNAEAMRAYESKGQVVHLIAGQKEHLQLQIISKANEDEN